MRAPLNRLVHLPMPSWGDCSCAHEGPHPNLPRRPEALHALLLQAQMAAPITTRRGIPRVRAIAAKAEANPACAPTLEANGGRARTSATATGKQHEAVATSKSAHTTARSLGSRFPSPRGGSYRTREGTRTDRAQSDTGANDEGTDTRPQRKASEGPRSRGLRRSLEARDGAQTRNSHSWCQSASQALLQIRTRG